MTEQPIVLLKLSGEVLLGKNKDWRNDPFPFDDDAINHICQEIHSVKDACRLAIILGGGNLFRGSKLVGRLGITPAVADNAGMLTTVINAMVLQDILEERFDLKTRLLSAIESRRVAEDWIRRKAISHLRKGRICILAGGTGNPRSSTDAAIIPRAKEINATIVLKGTKVDGVYDTDPEQNPDAKFIPQISHDEYVSRKLKVVDTPAVEHARVDGVNIRVFNIFTPGNLKKILDGENIGSMIGN